MVRTCSPSEAYTSASASRGPCAAGVSCTTPSSVWRAACSCPRSRWQSPSRKRASVSEPSSRSAASSEVCASAGTAAAILRDGELVEDPGVAFVDGDVAVVVLRRPVQPAEFEADVAQPFERASSGRIQLGCTPQVAQGRFQFALILVDPATLQVGNDGIRAPAPARRCRPRAPGTGVRSPPPRRPRRPGGRTPARWCTTSRPGHPPPPPSPPARMPRASDA